MKILGKNKLQANKLIVTGNNCLIIIIVLMLAVIINLLAARFHFRFDTTRQKLYSLSDQSKQTIKEFGRGKKRLKIYGFFKTGDTNQEMVQDLLKEYQKEGLNLSYQFVDPYKKQALAKQYQVQELGSLVLLLDQKEIKVLA